MQVIFLCKCWQLARLSNFTHSVLMTVVIVTIQLFQFQWQAYLLSSINEKTSSFRSKMQSHNSITKSRQWSQSPAKMFPPQEARKFEKYDAMTPVHSCCVTCQKKKYPTKSIAHDIRGFSKFPPITHRVLCIVYSTTSHSHLFCRQRSMSRIISIQTFILLTLISFHALGFTTSTNVCFTKIITSVNANDQCISM